MRSHVHPSGTAFHTASVNLGTISQAMLAERQARVAASGAPTVVLVEGLSDCFALETIAERLGCALDELGVAVLPTGGVTNIGR